MLVDEKDRANLFANAGNSRGLKNESTITIAQKLPPICQESLY